MKPAQVVPILALYTNFNFLSRLIPFPSRGYGSENFVSLFTCKSPEVFVNSISTVAATANNIFGDVIVDVASSAL